MQARYGTRTRLSDNRRCHSTEPARCGSSEPAWCEPGDGGFTLIELLVVIAILGLLISLVAPAVLRQLGGAKVHIAEQSIERMGSILDTYKLDVGSYPSSEDGLQALVTRPSDAEAWNGPYVNSNSVPVDPWNHPYIYRNPSSRQNHDYDLCSQGPNTSGNPDSELCNK